MNLFVAAATNAAAWNDQLASIRAGLSPQEETSLLRYMDRVQHNGRISFNMRQTTLNSFFAFGQHQNIYEWAEQKAGRSNKSKEEILQERLGDYYQRRTTFDRYFEDGEGFRYGALNIGGLGSWYYGEYCVVLKEEVASRPEVAYLRSDSLRTYMLPGPAVDETAIRRDTTPNTHRHFLAASKHVTEIALLTDDQWPESLCSNNDFIEVIFTGDITPGDIEGVRMSKLDYEVRFYFAFEDFRGRLSEFDRFIVDEFAMTVEHLDAINVSLEEV